LASIWPTTTSSATSAAKATKSASLAATGDTAGPSPSQPGDSSSDEPDQAAEDIRATEGPDSEGPDAPRSGRLDLASWTPQTAGDRSATVVLPSNWRLTAVADGAASVAGPNRQQVVLGFQTFVTPGSPTYAPYMGPEQALNWFSRIQGVQLVRLLDRAPAGEMNTSGEAEFFTVVTRQQDGSLYKALALVMTNQMQVDTWQFHISYIAAPVDQFDAAAPTMKAIWQSWKLDDGYVQGSQDRAAQTRAETGEMAMRGAARPGHALDNHYRDFDNTINGVGIWQDDTGRQYEVQFGRERQFLRDCVSKGRSCRQVPTNELGGQQ
jgi:hypothetical protein